MQVSTANDVKIYNLSYGKSIPEWLTSKQRRELTKKNLDVRRRIQLIQNFEMPDVANCMSISKDGRHVFAAGCYKPFLKCFDVEQMSEKFTRGIDEEVIKILNLTDDFQKFVLLEQQRWVELHYSRGRYFRLRIPKFGRDMDLITERSELVISTSGDEIYRLNLEQGEFLEPYRLSGSSGTVIQVAPWHQLIAAGTIDGTVECWDHRDKSRVGLLDVASSISDYANVIAAVTALKFCDPLHFGVGTSSGHVVLYDIRASKPLLVKDMQNDLPIRRIEFVRKEDDNIVLSMDNRAIKIWNERNGRPITAIEPEPSLNDFVLYPNSGMLFIAAEAPRMLQYFCPILGPAPKWCSFLEAITEELEESDKPAVYDDYKFVTEAQLDDLGLKHLIGTQLLRAYMHGFFIDIRLYNKAKLKTQPFAYENYKKRKIREAMEDEREEAAIGVKLKKESEVKVNRELAKKLELDASIANKKKKFAKEKANAAASLLQDPRFAKLFEDEEFEVDETSEIFTSLQSRLEKSQKKKKRPDEDDDDDENDGDDDRNSESDEGHPQTEFFDQLEEEEKVRNNGDVSSDEHNMETDSDEGDLENSNEAEMKRIEKKKERTKRKNELQTQRLERIAAEQETKEKSRPTKFKLYELESGEGTKRFTEADTAEISQTAPLATRRSKLEKAGRMLKVEETPFGGKSVTFTMSDDKQEKVSERQQQKIAEHQLERKEVRRAASKLSRSLDRKRAQRGRRH